MFNKRKRKENSLKLFDGKINGFASRDYIKLEIQPRELFNKNMEKIFFSSSLLLLLTVFIFSHSTISRTESKNFAHTMKFSSIANKREKSFNCFFFVWQLKNCFKKINSEGERRRRCRRKERKIL